MAAGWLRQGKPYNRVYFVLFVFRLGTANLFANGCNCKLKDLLYMRKVLAR
jgi:hypothetical protein